MNAARKQKRAKWISLLDTSSGGQVHIAEEEAGMAGVAPMGPSRQARKVTTQLCEGVCSVDSIESVLEVQL